MKRKIVLVNGIQSITSAILQMIVPMTAGTGMVKCVTKVVS